MPNDTQPSPASIWSALAQARAAMTPLVKDAENNFHNYRYTSADTMIGSGSRCLAAHGLSLIVTSAEIVTQENGDKTLRSVLTLTHSDGGVCTIGPCDMPVLPDKGRPLDKALCSARTVGLAYCYRDLLGIERPDSDDDIAGRDDTSFAPTRRKAPPARTKIAGGSPPPDTKPRAPRTSPLAKQLQLAMVAELKVSAAAATREIIKWGEQFGGRPTDEDLQIAIQMVGEGTHLMDSRPIAKQDIDDALGDIGRPQQMTPEPRAKAAGGYSYHQIIAQFSDKYPACKDALVSIGDFCDRVGLGEFNDDMNGKVLRLISDSIEQGKCRPVKGAAS